MVVGLGKYPKWYLLKTQGSSKDKTLEDNNIDWMSERGDGEGESLQVVRRKTMREKSWVLRKKRVYLKKEEGGQKSWYSQEG